MFFQQKMKRKKKEKVVNILNIEDLNEEEKKN